MTTIKFNRRPVQNGYTSLFDEFFNEFPAKWGKDWNGYQLPPVNIYENQESVALELNAPGRNKEDFKINIADGVLTVSFEKKESKSNETQETKMLKREFSFESFTRSFNLSEEINVDDIQAKYENGILKLNLPKKPVVNNVKEINVQ